VAVRAVGFYLDAPVPVAALLQRHPLGKSGKGGSISAGSCRSIINLSFFDPLVRANYFPYFPIFPACCRC
jgi:hypothetical protein